MAQKFGPEEIEKLIQFLVCRGYQVLGPMVRDGAIVYDEIDSAADLPRGMTDEQEAGRYRLKPREDAAFFGYALGPQSWKKYLHPAEVKLFEAEQKDNVFRILNGGASPKPRYAFLGIRACELAAIGIQDRVLLNSEYRDPVYAARRDQAFLIAVQCTQAAPTCFCASLGTGPQAPRAAVDLVLTEMVTSGEHWFLADAASDRGREALAELSPRPADEEDCRLAGAAVEAAARQTRHVDTDGLPDILSRSFEHPRWEQIAGRCLACANCTLVCPTCFCTTVEDVSDVTGEHAERWRRWDSCFTVNFSFIHGGSVRTSVKARYRQWLTHKFAAWMEQFGSHGCVGCGRCITWCPAGIDITQEIQTIRGDVTDGNTIT